MKVSKDLLTVKRFIEKKRTNKIKLAYHLGYASSLTVDIWLHKGALPPKRKSEILTCVKLLEEEAA